MSLPPFWNFSIFIFITMKVDTQRSIFNIEESNVRNYFIEYKLNMRV